MTTRKRLRSHRRALVALALLPLFAACRGGAPMLPAATQPGGTFELVSQHARVTTTATLFVPNWKPSGRAGLMHQRFISASTKGVEIFVYAHGSHSAPVAKTAANVAAGSALCANAPKGRTCTIPIAAPAGDDDFVVANYDLAPVGGAIPAAAKKLGFGVATKTIVQNGANQIAVAIGGVVASTFLSVPATTLHAIDTISQNATAGAKDADGNVIASNGYVDANGDPVTIVPAADANAGGAVTFSPASFAQPLESLTVKYDAGVATGAMLTNGFKSTLSVKAPGAVAGTVLLTVSPVHIAEFGTGVAGGNPVGIAVGPDGNIWYGLFNGGLLGRMTVAPQPAATSFPPATPKSGPRGMTVGSDGQLWFAESYANNVAQVTPAGLVTEFPVPTASSFPNFITNGPDGALWFSENGSGNIGRMTTTGSVTEYPIPTPSSQPQEIVTGPDGALWFTEFAGNKIGRITTGGYFIEYTIPTANSHPAGIAAGPDGALWFGESNTNKIGRLTTAGAMQEYVLQSGDQPFGLIAGPDGAMWFTDLYTYSNRIGRITTNGTVTEFTRPATGPAACLTIGPDGAIWFADYAANEIGRVQ